MLQKNLIAGSGPMKRSADLGRKALGPPGRLDPLSK
jgi:hypothetical protein